MSQVLNSLVVSGGPALQKALEDIMINNTPGYHVSFSTCDMPDLSRVDRPPDLVFIENKAPLTPEGAQQVVRAFPRKTYIVIDDSPDEGRRRDFLKAGIDEVMSLAQLQSHTGKHLLEKLLALKRLTEAEDRIEESEERFRGIIEHAHDVITLLDEDGTMIYNSRAFERLLGYESWEALGQSFFEFVHPEDRAPAKEKLRKLIAADDIEGQAVEFRFRHKDGRWRVFEAMVSNLLKNPLVRGVVLNSRDVTEHKESEAELEKYRHQLEGLVEQRTLELTAALKTEKMVVEQQKIFISMVSHEFRTPLTIIDGNAQILQSRGMTLTSEVLERRAGTIRAAVARLVRLIETILSEHTMDSGSLSVTLAPTDLSALLRDVCIEQLSISPDHKIRMDIQPGLPKMLLDEKLIRQIMANLVSNAVKYSPQNPLVEVRASRDGQMAVVEVTDHGVGIPGDELPKLFTRYFRASTAGGIPGSGLGLSLAKQFAELHDGRIDLQSAVGAGTTFTVLLPIHEKKQ